MHARRKTSKRQSDANWSSRRQQLSDLTFFVDRGLGRKVVPGALIAAGQSVELHDDHFTQDTPDVDWCKSVGQKGWIILTKDNNIRCNQVELEALMLAGVPSFCLSASDMSGQEMAKAFCLALPTMLNMVRKFKPPFVATVSRLGSVSLLYNHAGMIDKLGEYS